MRSTCWARTTCLGPSIWYACQRPAALARLHASLAFASHAVHIIATAARLWHGVLLSSLACYFLLHRSALEAIPVGERAGLSVRTGLWPYDGLRGGGHCAGCSPSLVELKISRWFSWPVRICWCSSLEQAAPRSLTRSAERGERLRTLVARAHGRHRRLIV